jgi:hypothetical protein
MLGQPRPSKDESLTVRPQPSKFTCVLENWGADVLHVVRDPPQDRVDDGLAGVAASGLIDGDYRQAAWSDVIGWGSRIFFRDWPV